MTFKGFTCWDPKVVHETIQSDVGAISADEDALFLATHVSLPVLDRTSGTSIETDEHKILEVLNQALEEGNETNHLVAITGPSGSGKTHLVRWVRANLERTSSSYEVIYIPRRATNLREITKLLLAELGGDLAAELQNDLDLAIEKVEKIQLSNRVFDALLNLMRFRPETKDIKFVDSLLPELKEKDRQLDFGGLSELLGFPEVRTYLLRRDGVVSKISGSILGTRSRGDTEQPVFTGLEFDFNRLPGVLAAAHSATGTARTALNVLSTKDGREAAAEILNRLRDLAIQEALGFREGRGLSEVFNEARERLAGGQLVLLFEDLALMDFVEGAVLDQFINHGDKNVAPLRVVFAVTDDKFAALPEGVRTRIKHQFAVGTVPLRVEMSNTEGVARRNEFFGRYLNVARVGKAEILASVGIVPNKCDDCGYKESCHDEFGSVETDIGSIGFYPYNDTAMTQAVNRLAGAREASGKVLTARSAVDALLRPVLDQAHIDLNSQVMPSEELFKMIEDGSVVKAATELVPEFVEGTPEFQRVLRVRRNWRGGRVESPALALAFELPSPGEEPEQDKNAEISDTVPPPPGAKELPREVSELFRWEQAGTDSMNADVSERIRKELHASVLARLQLGRHLISRNSEIAKNLLKASLGEASFQIENAPGMPQKEQLIFEIPKTSASMRFLVAAWWFRDHGHWIFDSTDRKWDLPVEQNRDRLPIEFETRLTHYAKSVEGAVLSTFTSLGPDPVRVAVALEALAEGVIPGDGGDLVAPAWREVVSKAKAAKESKVYEETVVAFAAARQSDQAKPAVIDSIRTSVPSTEDLLSLEVDESFKQNYLVLGTRWQALRDSANSQFETAKTELVGLVADLQRLADGQLVDVGTSAATVGVQANAVGVFGNQLGAFNSACERISESTLDRQDWDDFAEKCSTGKVTPDEILLSLRNSSALVELVDNLQTVNLGLQDAKGRLEARLISDPDGTDPASAVKTKVAATIQEIIDLTAPITGKDDD